MEQALDIIFYILSTLLGLAVGSFLNVCIYRLPRGNFFSKARSFCPKCNTPIKAYDNIPLLSYIILGGRCRACHERISPRYPIIEALNMVLWIVNYAVFGMTYLTIVYDVLASTMIVVAMIDFDTTEIPDSSIITIIILGLLTFIPVFDMSWQSKLIGAFCVSVPMLILAFFGGMGFGDVKLYFALGLLFGWEKMLVIFLLSMIFGSIYGIGNMIYLKYKSAKSEGNLDDIVDGIQPASEGNIQQKADIQLEGQDGDNDVITDDNIGTSITAQGDAVLSQVADEKIASNEEPAYVVGEETDNAKQCKICDCDKCSDEAKSEEAKLDEYERDLEEKITSGKAIPFGPFICLASLITMYFGDMIVGAYMKLLGL